MSISARFTTASKSLAGSTRGARHGKAQFRPGIELIVEADQGLDVLGAPRIEQMLGQEKFADLDELGITETFRSALYHSLQRPPQPEDAESP